MGWEMQSRLYTFVNGPTGIGNPFRQGIDSALSDAGSHGPLNVLGGIPTINFDYSDVARFSGQMDRRGDPQGLSH